MEVETQNNTSPSEMKIDIPDNIKEHEEEIEKTPPETKDDPFKEHRKSIDRIFVSQYMDTSTYNEEYGSDDYVVTYSIQDKSVLGWSIKENGSQPDVYFKMDKINKIDEYMLNYSVLSKKILLLRNDINYWLIDLNSDRTSSDRFLKLKHQVSQNIAYYFFNIIGFLPNGDLIQVLVKDRKIYKYCFTDKPKNTVPWEYSQINDIKSPQCLNDKSILRCFIYQTKLFLSVCDNKTFQFDLLTMNLERKYHNCLGQRCHITVNKNQALLAACSFGKTYVYSMENGMLIYENEDSGYGCGVQFITLKNTERLFIYHEYSGGKLVDPYQVYDEIVISDGFNGEKSVITELNRKIFIDNGNVCITNGLNGIDENKLEQLSNKITYRNSNYTFSTFKIIQSMLKEIINQDENKNVVSYNNVIVLKDDFEIENIGLGKLVLYNESGINYLGIEKDNGHREQLCNVLSAKLLNNQDLVVINIRGISIGTINDGTISNEERYLWYNNEWKDLYDKFREDRDINKHFKPLIEKILKNEFDDSKHSIPLPIFIGISYIYNVIIENVINDNLVSPKFGIEMLKIAIKEKHEHAIRYIIESTQDYSENYMTIISLNLVELCDYYPDFIIKYISSTSIMLYPHYWVTENSKNTSLHSYTDICIKGSNMENSYFKPILAIYKGLIRYLRVEEEIQIVSFIVPFLQIYVYRDDSKNNDHENRETEKDHDIKSKIITILKKLITGLKIIMMIPNSNSIWNKFLYKQKSILFCNIDSNNFYNWWNFAAIVDFKWKTFGKRYYYLIWLFYTIFYICYSLASTLEQKSIPDLYFKLLFTISIIFGSIFLINEIRYFLWDRKIYLNDIWNLFDTGAYLLPIITSIIWLINKSPPPWLTAISIILLSFKFLLFFRVFKSYGIYFAIVIGVAGKVFPFLVLLFFIVLGYAQAFFIILKSNSINDDDPRNLPTNLFNWFPTSLLAVYNLLTGDSGSLSSFTYRENPTMTILLVTFTFFTVIYLMNLFIGLLNIAIDDYNKEEEYLLQKAQIIMEIELFYMLPWQRKKKEWFPDQIYYDIPLTEVRKLINAIDNKLTVFNYPPIIDKELRKLVVLNNDNKKQDNEEEQNNKLEKKMDQLTKQNVKLKQQMRCIMKYIDSEKEQDSDEDSEKEQNNKLEEQIEQTKEELPKQNIGLNQQMDKLNQQMESIIKYIGIEQDNKEEKNDKLEKQLEQTKEELPKQNGGLKQQMDKLNQQMENIMELLLKRN
ncbi:7775_t:CDS:2 [Rhizophagus irregularis]|uniref:Ion transport domain-containing protein n=1 Tax=Rhizophagus irregularis (strain DAOM 197198w) TaxID=1432141 RepID=A0A015JDR4_RHIIW|nr:hypothetical protein RirG_113020 [Rhizophagus irregularis DAOM 197198w]CAG8611230.1 7775_t:CDS:2 [Rhizophagus irregularis]